MYSTMDTEGKQVAETRRIVLVSSLGKKFIGNVDVPNGTLRTTDLLNSGSIFWKDPGEKCFDNAILMHNVVLQIDDSPVRVRFDKLQVRLSEVILFYDDLESMTDDKEKMRAATMIQKTREQAQVVNIITTEVASSFFNLTGTFYGLFKKKANDKFIPLTDVKLTEIYNKGGKWFQKEIVLPHRFIGVSTNHIEALRLG